MAVTRLDRHLLNQILTATGTLAFTSTTLFVAFEVRKEIPTLRFNAEPWAAFKAYFPLVALNWCLENLHFALFFGVFLSIGLMARRNELATLLTGGISPLRIARSGILIGVFVSFPMCWAHHYFLPLLNRDAAWAWHSRIEHPQAMADSPITHAIFYNDRGDVFYFGKLFLKSRKATVIRFVSYDNDTGSPRLEVEGAEGRWHSGSWDIEDGRARKFSEGDVAQLSISDLTVEEKRLLSWPLESLVPQHRHLSTMTTSQLKDYRRFLMAMGDSGESTNSEIFRRWSASILPLMFLYISLAFAITAECDRYWGNLFSALLGVGLYNGSCLGIASVLGDYPRLATLGIATVWFGVLAGWKMRQ